MMNPVFTGWDVAIMFALKMARLEGRRQRVRRVAEARDVPLMYGRFYGWEVSDA